MTCSRPKPIPTMLAGKSVPSGTSKKVVKRKSSDGKAIPLVTPEVGGRDGPEPTRYGDWEKNGRCVDF